MSWLADIIELVFENLSTRCLGAGGEGMCESGRSPGNVTEALGMLDRALACLATADVASLPSAVQAEALRALGRAEARHTTARARMLSAFAAQGGFEDDGHGKIGRAHV